MTDFDSTPFIGREDLLAAVSQRLTEVRLVTLVGPGGVGKTRIGHRLVRDLATTYPHGCWMVELADLPTGDLVGHATAAALGLVVPDDVDPVTALTDFIADRRALLVIDNCEHLRDACADLIEVLRARCPEQRILTTSRRPLGLRGEALQPVEPLEIPALDETYPPAALAGFESVALFVARASYANPGFRLTEENGPDVADICAALGGIPLAIELAAARVRTVSLRDLVDGLTQSYGLVNRGYLNADDRHRSLHACIRWSFDLCTPEEQELWNRLAICDGGATIESAEQICSGDGIDRAHVLDLVSHLVDQSILSLSVDENGSGRYRMLRFLREYGVENLRRAGTEDAWRERHLLWYAELASRFSEEWFGPAQVPWLERLAAEHDNIRCALHFCPGSASRAAVGLGLAVHLHVYWISSGRLSEGRRWFEVALPAAGPGAQHRAYGLAVVAIMAAVQHDHAEAHRRLDEVGAVPEDPSVAGAVVLARAIVAACEQDFATAITDSELSRELFGRAGDTERETWAYAINGACRHNAGDTDGAVIAFEQAIMLAEEAAETLRRSDATTGLGEVALAAGDPARATDLYRRALRMRIQLGSVVGAAVSLDGLGRAAVVERDGQRAALLLGAAAAIWDDVGMAQTGNPFIQATARADGIENARRLLGKKEFRDTFRHGGEIGLRDAVDFALGDLAVSDLLDSSDLPVKDSPLTRRESEVADLVAAGLSNPEIAAQLVISVRTAQSHVENILRKLGFNSRSMIAAWVIHRRVGGDAPNADLRPTR